MLPNLFSFPLLLNWQSGWSTPNALWQPVLFTFLSKQPSDTGVGGIQHSCRLSGVSPWHYLCYYPQGKTPEGNQQQCQA